ncbi:SAM-dependent methyltransferase [Celeribacter indicus]|uniref:Type 11 methyltransferase n=1 Tax=Celeribacter indicus TaxID=1208324 RepID=A0A0B5E5W6_9RHOB|nr:class I SAM-dependent methyltransferase [Celeribacter indicus]AJE47722.1 type 11 methyltransferase [Celeribacter indicus]SDW15227.1 Methyltransferase domain-containing protein [Celeribacter indicus]
MSFWNDRYAGDDYVFGTDPAAVLPRLADRLPTSGRALCIADGEGRNSVWLARRGLAVTAFDPAPNALAKGRRLAAAAGVEVDAREADLDGWDWSQPFDLVAGIYIQFVGPDRRAQLFAEIDRATAPGGWLLLHGYTPKQVDHGTGGPKARENMYTEDMLAAAFPGYEILENRAFETELSEGHGHVGRSAVIDFLARKPG